MSTATKERKPRSQPRPKSIEAPPEPSPVELLHLAAIKPHPLNPGRVRCTPESIAELAESLRRDKQQQPILVRRHGEGFQIIFGERRYRAALANLWTRIEGRVIEADDQLALRLMAVENGQREDLDPIAIAEHLQELTREQPDGSKVHTQAEAGQLYGIKQAEVANRIRLLRLPECWLASLRSGAMSPRAARELLPLADGEGGLKLLEIAHREFSSESKVQWTRQQWSSGAISNRIENVVRKHARPIQFRGHLWWQKCPKLTAEQRRSLAPFELKLGKNAGTITIEVHRGQRPTSRRLPQASATAARHRVPRAAIAGRYFHGNCPRL